MRVLVIPEDFIYDQQVLKPIITAMLKKLEVSVITVIVCQDPRLAGIKEALHWSNILQIIEKRKWQIDLFLLCVD